MKDFEDHFGISRTTIWRLRRAGLPSVRVGAQVRFDPNAVRAWLGLPQDAPLARPDASLDASGEVPEAPGPTILPAGLYRCRGCNRDGNLLAPLPLDQMRCACGRVGDVERLGDVVA